MTTPTLEVTAASHVVAGVDTHSDTHHVAVLDSAGRRLGDREFPATPAGYEQLHAYVHAFGSIALIGVEGTSSYGAGLARYLSIRDVPIREVIRPKRAPRRAGKSDPIDAYAAARQALSEPETLPHAKNGDGHTEQIRVLLATRRSAIKARIAAARQIKSLLVTAPDSIRTRWRAVSDKALIAGLAATRPSGAITSVDAATAMTLRRLARRCVYLDQEITDAGEELRVLVAAAAPAMIATKGYGVVTTATLLITAGANPQRMHSEGSFAALCGASPIPASSGKTTRYRLNRGGDRQANWALHQIALVRLSSDPRTKAYAARLRGAGKTKKDILRCLKRAIAREAFRLLTKPHLVPRTDDLRQLRRERGATLLDVALSLGAEPARISELERGRRPNAELATAYRAWLNVA